MYASIGVDCSIKTMLSTLGEFIQTPLDNVLSDFTSVYHIFLSNSETIFQPDNFEVVCTTYEGTYVVKHRFIHWISLHDANTSLSADEAKHHVANLAKMWYHHMKACMRQFPITFIHINDESNPVNKDELQISNRDLVNFCALLGGAHRIILISHQEFNIIPKNCLIYKISDFYLEKSNSTWVREHIDWKKIQKYIINENLYRWEKLFKRVVREN